MTRIFRRKRGGLTGRRLRDCALRLRRDARRRDLLIPNEYLRDQWTELTRKHDLGRVKLPDIIVHPMKLEGVRFYSYYGGVLSDGSADLAEYGYVLPIHRVLATTSYDIPGHYDIYVRGSIKYSKNLGLYFRLDEESLVHELTHVLELTLGKKFGSLVKSKK